jgi:hypothetical protein
MKLKENSSLDLNINSLLIRDSVLDLNENFLSKQLFKNVRYINIFNTTLTSIQSNLFEESFERLEKITMALSNLDEFITRSENKWLEALGNRAVNSKHEILIEFHDIYSKYYDYPEKHFCQYRHFPYEQPVFVKLIGAHIFYNCTCTIYWLIQNRDRSSFVESLYTTSIQKCFEQSLSDSVRACQFDEKLRGCDKLDKTNMEPFTPNIHENRADYEQRFDCVGDDSDNNHTEGTLVNNKCEYEQLGFNQVQNEDNVTNATNPNLIIITTLNKTKQEDVDLLNSTKIQVPSSHGEARTQEAKNSRNVIILDILLINTPKTSKVSEQYLTNDIAILKEEEQLSPNYFEKFPTKIFAISLFLFIAFIIFSSIIIAQRGHSKSKN